MQIAILKHIVNTYNKSKYNMEIKEFNSQIDFVKNEEKFFSSPNEEVAIAVLNKTEVVYGADDSCNVEWCEDNNIPYIHQDKLHSGGCIVGVKGNIFIDLKMIPKDGKMFAANNFSNALVDYFTKKGLKSVRCDNNDVLIDGYKVASGCETQVEEFEYMGYQISINQDIETIKHVCNKPMVKIPKALSEYGITTEEMKKFCYDYWKNK